MRVSLQTGRPIGLDAGASSTSPAKPAGPASPAPSTSRQCLASHAASAVLAAIGAASLVLFATACSRQAEANTRADGNGGSAPAAPAASVATTPGAHAPDTISAKLDQSRILGDSTARVWFIMISDFQCPYCKQFHDESFEALRKDYVATGKVRMAYINFPLSIHQNAWPAAEAAMCAGAQGKFWAMHDVLFSSQSAWEEKRPPVPALDSLAYSVGVDTVALDRCVTQHVPNPLIDADIARAEHAGTRSTPTVIVGSRIMIGVEPTASYRRAIDSALATTK
jgi:protein-disulfide isomerase